MKKIILLLLIAAFTSHGLHAQNIFPATGAAGIGTTLPNASSLLEINSTTKGFLPPRMTLVQRNAIVTPAAGLLIYQTNSTPGLYYYSGTAWVAVSVKGANLSLSNLKGPTAINASLLPAAVDSIDIGSAALPMRRAWFSRDATINGIVVGTGGGSNSFNTALGSGALFSNTTGSSNTSTGFNTLRSNTTGYYNSAYGSVALAANTTGNYNTAYGAASLVSNTTGYNNTASGSYALYSNTTGFNNTASGSYALYSNTTGAGNAANGYYALYSNTSGYSNTANGYYALYANTTGIYNTANGYYALYSNTTANANTANGYYALYANTTGYDNTATGHGALANNTTGILNTANGQGALAFNTAGEGNTATGQTALNYNITGSFNTANGGSALLSNTTGGSNTAFGATVLWHNTTGIDNSGSGTGSLYNTSIGNSNTANGKTSMFNNITGSNNTAIGASADVSQGDLSNASAFGSNAVVDASNKVRIGNGSVTSIGGQVGWTNFSDSRIKQNIKENVPGLAFINLLKPVTYNFSLAKEYELMGRKDSAEWKTKYDIEKINFTGFVAQDVDAAATKIKYDFSGIDKTGKIMGLRYAEFVVPLVKAVQELSKQNDELKNKAEAQEKINTDLQKQINDLKTMLSLNSGAAAIMADTKTSGNAAMHVSPNPAANQIRVSGLSAGTASFIELTDLNGRSLLKQKVTGSTETIQTTKYAAGIYLLRYYDGSKWQQVKVVKE